MTNTCASSAVNEKSVESNSEQSQTLPLYPPQPPTHSLKSVDNDDDGNTKDEACGGSGGGQCTRFEFLTCSAGFLILIFGTLVTLSGMFLNVRPYKSANCSDSQSSFSSSQQLTTNFSSSPTEDVDDADWSEHQGFRSSLSVQYQLCNRATGDLTSVAFLVGAMAGSLVTGPTSDTIGRKPCMLAGQVFTALASLVSNYAPSFWLHLMCRALAGFCLMFVQCAVQVYGSEVHPPARRGRFLASWSTGVSMGTLAAGVLAHFTRDHQLYVLSACALPIIPALLCLCLPESPAWLAARGHMDRAETSLRRIDAINGRNQSENPRPPSLSLYLSAPLLETTASSSSTARPSAAVPAATWNCRLIRLAGVLGLHGLTLGLNCYGFYFVMGSVIPDVCLYAVLMGATQLPNAFLLNLVPRRPGLIVCSFLSGLVCFGFGAAAYFLPNVGSLLAALGVIGCFCATAGFYLLVSASAEHFPAGIRNTSLGLCTFCLRCGCAVSPLIAFLPGAPLQSLVMACPLLLTSLLLSLTLSGAVRAKPNSLSTLEANDEEEEEEEKATDYEKADKEEQKGEKRPLKMKFSVKM